MSYTKPGEILQRAATDRADARMKIQELEQKAREAQSRHDGGFFCARPCTEADEYRRRAQRLKDLYDM